MTRHPAVLLGSSLVVAAAVLSGCAAEPNAERRLPIVGADPAPRVLERRRKLGRRLSPSGEGPPRCG